MRVARSVAELESRDRAVAIGTFDGVHLGHRAVVSAALDAGPAPTVLTFDPHPRSVLGNRVELLATLERRLELLAELDVEDVLVVEFTPQLASLEPDVFAREYLQAIGAEVVVAGAGFRFGRRRAGDLALLERLGLEARPVPIVEGVSSTRIRELVHDGDVRDAARLLGRSVEADLLVPAYGIYAGAAGGRRAAVSIGTNPHYGGDERRIEAFLLDFEGDLYGERLVVELWERLRDERAFASEAELIAAIADDVARTRAASRPG